MHLEREHRCPSRVHFCHALTSATRSLQSRTRWALTGLGLALLVLLVLPSAQIKLGASQLNGLIGSYTDPGHYDVSYKGGTCTVNSNPPTDYSPNTSTSAPGAWGGGAYTYFTSSGGSITCAGQITAHFAWNPGPNTAPAPAAGTVIVTETANAYWSGPGSTGDCGLPNPTTPASTPPSQTATRYSVQGGSSFDVTCTPTASASGFASSPNSPLSANAFVGYAANISSVATISLPGSINDIDGTKKALTGQGVTAHLDGAPAHVTSYTWSFTGGTPIKNWDPSSTSNDKTIPLAPTDLSGTDTTGNGIPVADLSFYYTKAGSLTVTCTVNYTSPDGKPGTMTVQSPSIGYLKPTVTWLLTNFDPAFRHPKGFFTDPPNQQYGAEEPWGPINISVPDPFSGGHGYIAQIATLSRSFTRYNPQPSMPDTSYSKLSVLYNNGTSGAIATPTGLDISYPYPYGYTKGGTAANPTFTLVKSNYTWEVGSTGYSDDQPFASYTTTDVDSGGNLWHDSGANDSFDTWVMYQPPPAGGGTIYIPLMKLTWKWGGFASRYRDASGVWSAWTSGLGTPFTEGSPAITEAYPSWPLSIPSGFSVGP